MPGLDDAYQTLLLTAPTETVARHIAANFEKAGLKKPHAFVSCSLGLQLADIASGWTSKDKRHTLLAQLLTIPSLMTYLSGSVGKGFSQTPKPS